MHLVAADIVYFPFLNRILFGFQCSANFGLEGLLRPQCLQLRLYKPTTKARRQTYWHTDRQKHRQADIWIFITTQAAGRQWIFIIWHTGRQTYEYSLSYRQQADNEYSLSGTQAGRHM